MATTQAEAKGFRFPIFQGLLPIKASQVPTEIIAGITLAALAIPEVMGYTKISGPRRGHIWFAPRCKEKVRSWQ